MNDLKPRRTDAKQNFGCKQKGKKLTQHELVIETTQTRAGLN